MRDGKFETRADLSSSFFAFCQGPCPWWGMWVVSDWVPDTSRREPRDRKGSAKSYFDLSGLLRRKTTQRFFTCFPLISPIANFVVQLFA